MEDALFFWIDGERVVPTLDRGRAMVAPGGGAAPPPELPLRWHEVKGHIVGVYMAPEQRPTPDHERQIDEARARLACVRLAKQLDGLGMASNAQGYLAHIAFREDPRSRKAMDMCKMSGCALITRGMWHRLGIEHDRLRAPYEDQMAVSDLVQIAQQARAVRACAKGLPRLHPADVILVGGEGLGGPEHVWTVLDPSGQGYPDATTAIVVGLDGGQRDEKKHQQLICTRVHEIVGVPPRDVTGVPPELAEKGAGRVVRYVLDFGAIWTMFGRWPEEGMRT